MTEVVEKRKVRLATTSLAGCFGCHISFLDIDERLFELIEHVEFDRSPLTDIKHCAFACPLETGPKKRGRSSRTEADACARGGARNP